MSPYALLSYPYNSSNNFNNKEKKQTTSSLDTVIISELAKNTEQSIFLIRAKRAILSQNGEKFEALKRTIDEINDNTPSACHGASQNN